MIDLSDIVRPVWFEPVPAVGLQAFIIVGKKRFFGFQQKILYREFDGKWHTTWVPVSQVSLDRSMELSKSMSFKISMAYNLWIKETRSNEKTKAKNIKKWISIW